MAGGEGRRLLPLTETTPKPMLKVGGVPLLEHILGGLVRARYRRIFIVTRYLAEQIESYFGNGAGFGCDIAYLREPVPYGTAGGLALIPARETPTEPFLVVNADILCPLDFAAFRDWHIAEGNAMSLVGREHTYMLPYGYPIVYTAKETSAVMDFREKPTFMYRVNSGMYVLDPWLLDAVPRGYFDMPDLIRWACARATVGLYPLTVPYHEIGSLESYAAAEAFYERWMR